MHKVIAANSEETITPEKVNPWSHYYVARRNGESRVLIDYYPEFDPHNEYFAFVHPILLVAPTESSIQGCTKDIKELIERWLTSGWEITGYTREEFEAFFK